MRDVSEGPVLWPGRGVQGPRADRAVRRRSASPGYPPPGSQIDSLRRLILDEVAVKVLGLPGRGPLRGAADWLLHIPAQRFAELGAGFDAHLGRGGFAAAARWVLPYFVRDWRAYGTEHIPRQGPLLIVANHPGTYDVLVVAAEVPRSDLKVVAGNISFLKAFAAAERGLIFAGRDYAARATALRAAVRHLEAGSALLIFPSENIGPDPECAAVGPEDLEQWSPSIEWMLRHVPQASVVVAIVRGVITRACYRHPLTRLRRAPEDRRRVASLIQMVGQLLLRRTAPVVPTVCYATAVTVPGARTRAEVRRAMETILAKARQMLAGHPQVTL